MIYLALLACEGPAGTDGLDGVDGTSGEGGAVGSDGLDGTDGDDGEDGEDGEDLTENTLRFADVGFPETDDERRSLIATQQAWVNGEPVDVGYHTILRTGEVVGGGTFGLLYDIDGAPLLDGEGLEIVSVSADFSSLLLDGDDLYAVTHFESAPGALYLTALSQDAETGELSAQSTASIDLSGISGIYSPCAGQVTPWGSHLASEEYPPDARSWEDALAWRDVDLFSRSFVRYWGYDVYTDKDKNNDPDGFTVDDLRADYQPYRYGYPVEVTLSGGTPSVERHYSMGRTSIELAYVMPDERTVYITDDGTNVGLFLFIADVAGDLSAGNLYAMKWHQTDDAGAGQADLEWLSLGHATDEEVAAFIDKGLVFSDMFDTANPILDKKGQNTGRCPKGFGSINVGDRGMECLQVRKGMEVAASRLESDRYGAILGGTFELRKGEGLTHDPDHSRLYFAISELRWGMESYSRGGQPSGTYDLGGPDDIRLESNECGAIYALDLVPSSTLGSDYIAQHASALMTGYEVDYVPGSLYAGNECSISGIANPDNLSYLPDYQVLLIAEDSSSHTNDVLWAYDLRDGTLDRILTAPYGSEHTSAYFYPDINGWAYLRSVVQHPFGEFGSPQPADDTERAAYDGYIGPLPALR